MAKLINKNFTVEMEDAGSIRSFLTSRGIFFDQWVPEFELKGTEDQETVLKAFEKTLRPFMNEGGYKVADVISVHAQTPNLEAVRAKFIREHRHVEDEVRYFVKGQAYFWFHLESGEIFCLLCEKGDLISVPKQTRHWFEMGEIPDVVAIRIFIDPAGWVAHYTDSGVDSKYVNILGYAK